LWFPGLISDSEGTHVGHPQTDVLSWSRNSENKDHQTSIESGEMKNCEYIYIPFGKRLHNELERSTMLLMGKLTISMAMFNDYVKLEGSSPSPP
jgi:hypothetical protein